LKLELTTNILYNINSMPQNTLKIVGKIRHKIILKQ